MILEVILGKFIFIISSQIKTQFYKHSHMKKATLTQFLFNSLAPQPTRLPASVAALSSLLLRPILGRPDPSCQMYFVIRYTLQKPG